MTCTESPELEALRKSYLLAARVGANSTTMAESSSSDYRRYATTLLLLVYVFNQLDRGVFNILMEPIKREFALSDTQLGFATGPALVILYSALGVPVARWADRRPRVVIMSVAIALWSLVTVWTATVSQFWQLALARVGVGIGEAGFSAIAISVIGDYENDLSRARAISNFMLAIPSAFLMSDLIGGWVSQLYGWRWVFLIAGAPGIALSLLMWLSVREPPRREAAILADPVRPTLRVVLSTLWQRRSLRHLAIAQAFANIALNAIGWVYVFFVRGHGMTTGELGSWLGVIDGVGPFIGIWLSGLLASRLATHAPAMSARLMAYAAALVAPLALIMLWCPSKHGALVAYFLLTVPTYFFLGPTQGLLQDLVGPSMRATTSSVFILIQLVAGGVIGIQLVGFLSDVLTPFAGDSTSALRWSMALGSLATVWAALHFFRAGRFIEEDWAAARRGAI